MKIISNLIHRLTASLVAATISGSLVVVPVTTLALSKDSASGSATKTSQFCTKLPSEAGTISSHLTNLITNAETAWSNKSGKWATEWQKVDQNVASDRQKADSERTQDYAKLNAKAKTTTEQQEVQTYEAAVNNAVSVRRAAYDTARQSFRSGVEAAISARQGSVTGQVNTFQTSVNSAIMTAEASCASNPASGASVSTALQAALKTARETFQGDRKNDTTINSQVQQLAETRKAAFKAADQTFHNSLNAATAALKQAFGRSSGSV